MKSILNDKYTGRKHRLRRSWIDRQREEWNYQFFALVYEIIQEMDMITQGKDCV